MECNKELVKEFLYLDDSINSVAEQWVLCKRGLEAYSQDQALVQGRRTLLEMEWRCFKAEENNKNRWGMERSGVELAVHPFHSAISQISPFHLTNEAEAFHIETQFQWEKKEQIIIINLFETIQK